MPHRLRPLLAILVLGAFSQVAQAVLIREGLVVFYGNEVSLGAFYASWLFWLTAGPLLALPWGEGRGPAMPAVGWILLALPLVRLSASLQMLFQYRAHSYPFLL